MSWTWTFANELGEEIGEKVDISGLSKDIHDTSTNRQRIRQMVTDAVENAPDDEEIREIAVRFDPWELPKVTVWCKSTDFNYNNSKVVEVSSMVNGKLYKWHKDTRPF